MASTDSGSKGTIVVSGKQDIEARVLSEMDVLLLQKAGYTIVSKQALGDSPIVFNAIKSNAVDLYPDSVLAKYPGIRDALNPLALYLITDASIQWRAEVTTKKTVVCPRLKRSKRFPKASYKASISCKKREFYEQENTGRAYARPVFSCS